MPNNVLQFPDRRGASSGAPVIVEPIVTTETVRTPVELFHVSENGQVDLADGVTITDAVASFWESLQGVVSETWASHPLAQERSPT
jgi:hypothetical protein